MSKTEPGGTPDPARSSHHSDAEWFRKAGFSAAAADAIVGIDETMARIRRGMIRRELVAAIVVDLDPNLDLIRLDVISAILHWVSDDSDAQAEVTVGTVAERLGVDPSRASRLVAAVVDLGYVRRTASQSDSRRIVLEPTDKALAFGQEFRRRKSAALANGLKDWTEEELVTFNRLVERFSHWTRRGLEPSRKPSTE